MSFPPDSHAGGADFASRNWVYQPWKDPNAEIIKLSNPSFVKFDGDGDPKYHDAIYWGILSTAFLQNNGYTFDTASRPELWNNIEQYVHILAPPTKYAWGIGRMWHHRDGGLWYITVPLMPEVLIPKPGNLKAVSIDLGVPQGQKAEPGAEYIATVVFENESDQPYPGTPVAVLHGDYQAALYDETGQVLPKKVVGGKEIHVADFGKKGGPNARRAFNCKWHPFGQTKDGLTGIVNRDEIGKVYQETTYEDNVVSAEIPVELVNLKVTSITLSPDSGQPNHLTSGVITVQNESERDLQWVRTIWRVRHSDGTVLDEGTLIADFAAGESKELPFSFTPDRGDTYSVAAMVNPDGDWPPNEVNLLSGDWPGDNRMEVSYYVEEPCTDISVTAGIKPLSVQSGGSVTVKAFVERAWDGPDRSVPVNVNIYSDYGGSKRGTLWLDRGGSKSFSAEYSVGGGGEVSFTVEAWPDGIEDCRPGNNRDSIGVYVEEPFETPDVGTGTERGKIRVILIS